MDEINSQIALKEYCKILQSILITPSSLPTSCKFRYVTSKSKYQN